MRLNLRKFFGKKNLFISVLLTMVFAVTSFVPIAAAGKSFGSFSLEFLDDTSGSSINANRVDLSGIKIDVYDSVFDRREIDPYDPMAGADIYAHNYSYSAYTKADGTVDIKKPSDVFLIMVDLATLPAGIGINKEQVLYHDASQKSDTLNISEIANFTVSYDSSIEGSVRVDILNANGEQIKANYTITPNTISNARTALLDKTYQISGSVTVNGISKSYQYTVSNTADPIENIADALSSGEISKNEALDFYLEIWEAGAFGECGTFLATQFLALYEDAAFFNQLSTERQSALVTRANPPTYVLEMTYSTSPAYFVVHYEGNGLFGTIPQVVQDINAALIASQSEFVSRQGYNKPFSTVGGSQYHVYIVADGSNPPNGWCQPDSYSNAASYVVMNISSLTASLSTSYKDTLYSALAHEYFHAITNTYRYGLYDLNWFGDAVASWASRRQYGTAGNGNSEINTFLDWTNTSLPSQNAYGACLFPLYIHIYNGGDAVIKNIHTRLASGTYPSYTYNVYNAIGYYYSGGFASAFSGFWAYNYAPKSTYPQYATGMNSKPGISQYYFISNLPNSDGPYTVNYLASQFMEFGVPSSGGYTVSVTVNVTSGTSSNLGCFLLFRTASGAFATYNMSSLLGSIYSVVVSSAYSYTDGCVVPVNCGTSGSISYKLTITER